MHSLTLVAATAALLCAEPSADSLFSRRSLGISVGGNSMGPAADAVKWALPLDLTATVSLDRGFELWLQVSLMLAYATSGVLLPSGDRGEGLMLGTVGRLGARYLFLQGAVRPWVGVCVGATYLFREPAQSPPFTFGPGVAAGVEFFVVPSVSVGARVFGELRFALSSPVHVVAGGAAGATFHW